MLLQAAHNLSFGVYAGMIDSGVRAGSGHIGIYKAGYLDNRDEGLLFNGDRFAEHIEKTQGVEHVLPRLYIPALAQSSRESRGVLLIGVEPERERQVNPFLKSLPSTAMVRSSNSRDAIIGVRLLEQLQLQTGQKFVVTAQHRDGTLHSELLRVRGVVSSGMKDVDESLILIGRDRASTLTGNSNRVHELAVILTNIRYANSVHRQITASLSNHPEILAVGWEEAMPNLANAIKLDYASQKLIFLIILIIVTIGVVNTQLMSVMERMREFGVILAIGSKPRTLQSMIMIEALSLGILAAFIGSILGSFATWYLVTEGINLEFFVSETLEFGGVVFDPIMRARWDLEWMIKIAFYVVGLILLASTYPAYKAGKITPIEGMRHQ